VSGEWSWHAEPMDAELRDLLTASPEVAVMRCRTNDGTLRGIRRYDEDGLWRLSVTWWPKRRRSRRRRLPTWEECADAAAELLPANVVVVIEVPTEPTTLTLRETRRSTDDERPDGADDGLGVPDDHQ
jgi:hypothetical protein